MTREMGVVSPAAASHRVLSLQNGQDASGAAHTLYPARTFGMDPAGLHGRNSLHV